MKLTNTTASLLTTWTGEDIPAGETRDVDVSPECAEWLLRHGCTKTISGGTKTTRKKASSGKKTLTAPRAPESLE